MVKMFEMLKELIDEIAMSYKRQVYLKRALRVLHYARHVLSQEEVDMLKTYIKKKYSEKRDE